MKQNLIFGYSLSFLKLNFIFLQSSQSRHLSQPLLLFSQYFSSPLLLSLYTSLKNDIFFNNNFSLTLIQKSFIFDIKRKNNFKITRNKRSILSVEIVAFSVATKTLSISFSIFCFSCFSFSLSFS
jgi:hypothetical protein